MTAEPGAAPISANLGPWLGAALLEVLDADARLAVLRDEQLPRDQVRDARLALAAAVERLESLAQLVAPGVSVFRCDLRRATPDFDEP